MKFFSRFFLASKFKLIIPTFGIIALVVFSSLILYESRQLHVVIAQDGKDQAVKTDAKTVGDLLEEVGIIVGEHDALSYDEDTAIENGMEIEYKESKKIYVQINDIEEEFYTLAETIGEFLASVNLEFTKHDDISHKNHTKIEDGLHFLVKEAYPIVINDAGEKIEIWTTGESVKQLLNKSDIEIEKLDKVKPALDKQVNHNTNISIVRVNKETEVIEEDIAFKTENKQDDSLAKGKEKVISEGKLGTIVKEFEITLENGEEVNRELVSEEVKEEPTNKVVALGTKEQKQKQQPKQEQKQTENLVTLSSSNKSSSSEEESSPSEGKSFTMTATAYSINCSGCDGNGITATGINLKTTPKVIAVDPNVIPLGSKVWVEGYGNAIAGDTGGAIKGNRIDVHVSSSTEAMNYGKKQVQVKILD